MFLKAWIAELYVLSVFRIFVKCFGEVKVLMEVR